jgi:hypothetical protein
MDILLVELSERGKRMVRMTAGPGKGPMHAVALLAFDARTGRVHATFVHGSFGEDAAGVARSRERLGRDIRNRITADVELEFLELPLHELPEGLIEMVDPKTRKLVVSQQDALPRTRLGTKASVPSGLSEKEF